MGGVAGVAREGGGRPKENENEIERKRGKINERKSEPSRGRQYPILSSYVSSCRLSRRVACSCTYSLQRHLLFVVSVSCLSLDFFFSHVMNVVIISICCSCFAISFLAGIDSGSLKQNFFLDLLVFFPARWDWSDSCVSDVDLVDLNGGINLGQHGADTFDCPALLIQLNCRIRLADLLTLLTAANQQNQPPPHPNHLTLT